MTRADVLAVLRDARQKIIGSMTTECDPQPQPRNSVQALRPLYPGSGAEADATPPQRHRTPPGPGDSIPAPIRCDDPGARQVSHHRSVRASLDQLIGLREDRGRDRNA